MNQEQPAIFDFKAIKSKSPVKCESPIVVDRTGENTFNIGFHVDCFAIEYIDNQFRAILWAQDQWKLFKLDDVTGTGKYSCYMVQIADCYVDQVADNLMSRIAQQATRAVLLNEVRRRYRSFPIRKLAFTASESELNDVLVSYRTVQVLTSNGITNLSDLSRLTREQLCCMEGIQTKDVSALEINLASMGHFLKTAPIESWHGYPNC